MSFLDALLESMKAVLLVDFVLLEAHHSILLLIGWKFRGLDFDSAVLVVTSEGEIGVCPHQDGLRINEASASGLIDRLGESSDEFVLCFPALHCLFETSYTVFDQRFQLCREGVDYFGDFLQLVEDAVVGPLQGGVGSVQLFDFSAGAVGLPAVGLLVAEFVGVLIGGGGDLLDE